MRKKVFKILNFVFIDDYQKDDQTVVMLHRFFCRVYVINFIRADLAKFTEVKIHPITFQNQQIIHMFGRREVLFQLLVNNLIKMTLMTVKDFFPAEVYIALYQL